jgi:hypothetical protein
MEMDDCELSFAAGRLQVVFSRRGKLIQSRVLDIDAIERLADRLETLDEPEPKLEGDVAVERPRAYDVSQQLRAFATALRGARDLWSDAGEGSADTRAPRARVPPRSSSTRGRVHRPRIARTKRDP